jgi:hypothetical protein
MLSRELSGPSRSTRRGVDCHIAFYDMAGTVVGSAFGAGDSGIRGRPPASIGVARRLCTYPRHGAALKASLWFRNEGSRNRVRRRHRRVLCPRVV